MVGIEMNQEQKDKLEQAAQRKWEEDRATNPTPVNPHAYVYGFKAAAQTILDNYHDYGLQSMEKYKDMVSANVRLGAENTSYRQHLESIAARWNKVAEHNEMRTALHLIQQDVFEALKNNEG